MKKVTFTSKPTAAVRARSPDQWVNERSHTEPNKRLTIDIPSDLHRTMKVQCAVRGERMADVVRELLEKHFAAGYEGNGGAGDTDH